MMPRHEPPGSPAFDQPDDVTIVQDGAVRRVTLTRPARRNALSRSLVGTLRYTFEAIREGGETRVVVLAGEGPVFCAGADITEFAESAATGHARVDAEGLAKLLAVMTTCPAPIVARVHGAAYGGGAGLVWAADVVIAAEGTRFSLSEARLGLIPAVIAPYVIAALGEREAKTRMLLAAPFGVADALRHGLIYRAAPADALPAVTAEVVTDLLRGAPGALAAIKRLPSLVNGADPAATRAATTDLLVERLASDEGREGLRAFLEKRPATWVPRGSEPR